MTESTKTLSMIIAAGAVLALAFATRPRAPSTSIEDVAGQQVFPDLKDALAVKRMKIVTFDEDTSRAREFEVAQNGKSWSLPSHKDYPADATKQVSDAVTALVDVKYLGPPISTSAKDHELYGVVEPNVSEDQFGLKGVGKKVELTDGAGKALARVIIGKEDKSPKAGDAFSQPETQLRFIRIPGQDAVYRVSLRTDKFSTKFQDWIETDLMKMNAWDISEIKLRDYSLVDAISSTGEVGKKLQPRADIDLAFDDKTSKWALKDLQQYKGKNKEEVKLADNEELDLVHLNDLKNGLTALKIIDVARKPAQMSADLKAGKDFVNDEAYQDLIRRGFFPVPVGENQVDILSNEGEATVRMKDGVEYVLRFGKVAGIETASDEEKKADADKPDVKKNDKSTTPGDAKKETAADDAAKSDDAKDDEKSGTKKDKAGGLSRYIMVMAQFNEDLLPKPELEPLPEAKKPAEKPADVKPSPDDKSGKKSDAKKGDAKADAKKSDAKSESKPADAKSDAPSDEDQEAIDAERDKIEKENKRKQDAYADKVKAGQQKAKELNARFADWYYVVNDDTYKKIHLGKTEIVKKKADESKTPKDAGDNSAPKDPFNGLRGLPGVGN